jgi:hypothetical protein
MYSRITKRRRTRPQPPRPAQDVSARPLERWPADGVDEDQERPLTGQRGRADGPVAAELTAQIGLACPLRVDSGRTQPCFGSQDGGRVPNGLMPWPEHFSPKTFGRL